MEGYSNYQQVIDAIKAEYVNARDLKRKATGKNRTAKNADSFKKRKESESKSLDSKLNSVKESLKKSLSGAIYDLDQSKFSELKTKLSELQAKLEYIDSESNRFDELNGLDPKKYPAKSNTEKQTFSVVRSLLAAAIKDAEAAIEAVYNGGSYISIVTATMPNSIDNTEDEVNAYYDRLEMTYSELFDKAENAISIYTNELFPSIDAIKQQRKQLIELSQNLSEAKSRLATLLEDEASQSEIDSAEVQIEDTKKQMLESVSILKMMDIASNEWMFGKFHSVSVFIDDLYDFQDEFIKFYENNYRFLVRKSRPMDFVNAKTNRLYDVLFNVLIDNYKQLEGTGTTEFDLVYNGLAEGRQEFLQIQSDIYNADRKIRSLTDPREIFDMESSAISTMTKDSSEFYKGLEFYKGISIEQKSFYINASKEIHSATEEYMTQKSYFDVNMNKIQEFMNLSKAERSNHEAYAENLSHAMRNKLQYDFKYSSLSKGRYEGTEEQQQAFNEARDSFFQAGPDYMKAKSDLEVSSNEYSIFKGIFPDFYESVADILAEYKQASDAYKKTSEKYNRMEADLNAAYEYLQTLTAGEAEYVSALADYEAKYLERDAYYERVVQPAQTASDDAYNYLQTLIEGEAGYQSLVVSLQETIDANKEKLAIARSTRSTAENNRRVAIMESTQAQSDKAAYIASEGSDQAIIDAYDATIAQANATIAQADATIAQANSDIVEAETTIDQAKTTLKNATESHYIYLGAQTDYDAKLADKNEKENQYKSLSDTSEESYIFLQTLTDEDEAYHSALADWNKKDTEVNSFREEVVISEQKLNAAEDSLTRVAINQVGQDINFPVYGEYLIDLEKSVAKAEEKFNTYAEELAIAEQAFEVAKAEMTLVESTPYEKREAILVLTDSEKSQSQLNSWDGIVTAHTSYLAQLMNRIIDVVTAVRENPFFVKTSERLEAGEAEASKTMYVAEATKKPAGPFRPVTPISNESDILLQAIKEFMISDNTYTKNQKASIEANYRQYEVYDKMKFYSACIKGLDLDSSFDVISDIKENLLSCLASNDSASFHDSLRYIIERKIQMFSVSKFAYKIEDEVNNGNPIVPGQNGGGKGDFPS